MTLTRRLLLLAIISVLPAFVIWTYTEVTLRREREAEVRDLALRQAQLAASEIDRVFEGVRNILVTVGEVASVQALDTPACTAFLAGLKPKVPQLVTLSVLDLDGRLRCRHAGIPEKAVRYDDRSYFKKALETGDLVVGDFTRSRLTDQKGLPLATPLRDAAGTVVGVMVAGLDLTWFGHQLSERSLPTDGSITVADGNGIIIAREPFSERFVGTPIPDAFRTLVHASSPGAIEVVSQDGTKRVLGYIPISKPTGVYVSAGLSSKLAFSTINEAAKRGFMLIAAAFCLALSLAWLTGRVFVTKPFDKMIAAVGAWRRGDYAARIDIVRSSGEMGTLAHAFNDLMDDVARRQSELQDSEERARLALEAGQMGTWWFDPVAKKGGWSAHTAKLLGLPQGTSPSSLVEWQKVVHPEDKAAAKRALEGAMKGRGHYEAEFRVSAPGERERWIDSRGRVFFDAVHRPVRVVGIVQDITSRKNAEMQQRLLLDELNHRVKNTLATVQSIASQTLRSTTDPAGFREAFESRLLALSKTHDLLTRNAWREADLTAIVEQEIVPYRRDSDDRIVVSGPKVSLPARAAINLGLVVHELVTNAAKYGALSAPRGRLDLSWSVATDITGQSTLHLSWREKNGPPVHEPTRRGFGSKLLQRSVEGELNGRVVLRFLPSGVVCELFVPLPPRKDQELSSPSPLAIAI